MGLGNLCGTEGAESRERWSARLGEDWLLRNIKSKVRDVAVTWGWFSRLRQVDLTAFMWRTENTNKQWVVMILEMQELTVNLPIGEVRWRFNWVDVFFAFCNFMERLVLTWVQCTVCLGGKTHVPKSFSSIQYTLWGAVPGAWHRDDLDTFSAVRNSEPRWPPEDWSIDVSERTWLMRRKHAVTLGKSCSPILPHLPCL